MPARFSAICMQRKAPSPSSARRGDVVGIARQAVADDLGVDAGAARLRVLEFLEHDDAGALAHDEAVAVAVLGARGACRLVVEARSTAPWRRQSRRCAMRQTGDSAPPATMTSASPSAIRRAASPMACAPVEQAVTTAWFGPLQAVLDRDLAGGEVDQAAGNEERADAARAAVAQRVAGLVDACDAADAGADEDAGAIWSSSRLRLPAGVGERLVGRGHRIDDEGVDLALFLRLHPVVGVEGAVGPVAARQLAGDLAGQVVDLEIR